MTTSPEFDITFDEYTSVFVGGIPKNEESGKPFIKNLSKIFLDYIEKFFNNIPSVSSFNLVCDSKSKNFFQTLSKIS